MGKILSKFKKKERTTYQKLEILEEKIKNIESFSGKYQLKQKRFVGNLLLYGVGISIIAFMVFYFAFLPETVEKRIIHSIPLLLFPILIFLMKCLVGWYFQRKVNNNTDQLSDLRMEKKEILEQVMNKETYKVALEILNRFGGNDRYITSPIKSNASTPVNTSKMMINSSTNMTPAAFKTPANRLNNVNSNISSLQQRLVQTTPVNQNRSTMASTASSALGVRNNNRTPYPIIDPSSKGVVDKMVDYLIGDGPANRFAMICQECYKHNGMALQEEYEYSAFRCAFCNFFNPAKKLRPLPPKLQAELASNISFTLQKPSTSSSDSDSDSKPSRKELFEELKQPSEKQEAKEEESEKEEIPEHPDKPHIEKKLE
ncbi:unnamed protein product [Diamesa serratosioi]